MNSTIGFLVICMVGVVVSQRPSYVPQPVRYPDVAPRFRVSTSTEQVELGNRNGVTTSTERLPVDARGNVDIVNQIKSWPEDKRPYWYINAEHIENARGRPVPGAGQQMEVNVPNRSSFLA